MLVTDFWILPDVDGGVVSAGDELMLAMAVMPHVVEMLGHGGAVQTLNAVGPNV
jgi:hypothetical protein